MAYGALPRVEVGPRAAVGRRRELLGGAVALVLVAAAARVSTHPRAPSAALASSAPTHPRGAPTTPSPTLGADAPSRAPTTPRPSPQPSSAPTPFSYSLVKRTYSSADASGDAAFLREFLGLEVTFNKTYHDTHNASANDVCATRVIVKALPNFEVHFFESHVAPEGELGVAYWAEYFKSLHAGFVNASDWDAFMANSMTFYTPDLTPFARKMRARGVPTLSVTYEHVATTEDAHADMVPLYSVSAVVPGTGALVELVSEHVDDDLKAHFGAWPASSCADANKITQRVSGLRELWKASGGAMLEKETYATGVKAGLPDVLIAKVAFPGDVDDFETFVGRVLGHNAADGCCTLTRSSWSNAANGTRNATEHCSWGTVEMSSLGVDVAANMDDASASNAYAELRVVQAPAARVGALSVADWGDYVQNVHATWTRENVGWDRFLDDHFGIEVGGARGALDRYVAELEALNVSYRAKMGGHGAGSANRSEGSLWTAGSGGQGVELHGDFDWSVLVANETAGMDYCASPAIAGSTARGAAELSAAS